MQQAFGTHRLLTFDCDPATCTPTVEIAHEALLSEWPRLAGWLEENRDDVRLQRRLTAAAAEWLAAGQPPGLLASDTRLAQYMALSSGDTLALTRPEAAYVVASAAAEEAREEQEQRTTRLPRGLGIGASVAAAVAILLALSALMRVRRRYASGSEPQPGAGGYSRGSAGSGGDGSRAGLAIEAANIDGPPADALSKLAAVAYGRGTRAVLNGHSAGVRAASFSPDGQEVLSGSGMLGDENGQFAVGEVIRWNLDTGEEVARWTGMRIG